MTRPRIPAAFALGLALATLLPAQNVHRPRRGPTSAQIAWPCGEGDTPAIDDNLPFAPFSVRQADLNCFAWKEFIALNWDSANDARGEPDHTKGPATFGTPGDFTPAVWETYKSAQEVFLPHAAAPKAWNEPPPPPPCDSLSAAERTILERRPAIAMLSKFSGQFSTQSILEADGNWLADQSSNPIWFEMKMNRDEFDTIISARLYNANVQRERAAAGKGSEVMLRAGRNTPDPPIMGAIELKAAWRIITDKSDYSKYKMTDAVTVVNGKCTAVKLGLVGLHIVHKTESQPQWIWATFEHVDNAPDKEQAKNPSHPFTFFNPDCKPKAIPDSCVTKPPAETSCSTTPIPAPAYSLKRYFTDGQCPPYPIQVVRKRAIANSSADPVASINAAAHELIASENKESVFQHYELVDVLWSQSGENPYGGDESPVIPLSRSGMTPSPALPVANTAMETYVQGKTCTACHALAHIAGLKTGDPEWASDFSFLLGMATTPETETPEPRDLGSLLRIGVKHRKRYR